MSSIVGGADPVDPEDARELLSGVALRILGSHADAADAVQEAYGRWYAQPPEVRAEVVSPAAWLVTVVSRICLDVLKSARARRERYVGPWLPEPLPTGGAGSSRSFGQVDPQELVALDEAVTAAMLIVLDAMSPAERVAFVLHDVFSFPFAEIASVLGRSPAACRQLAAAGRRKLRARADSDVANPDSSTVSRLKRAWEERNVPALVALLDPDAVAVVDGGGLVSAPTEPVRGAGEVASLLVGALRRAPLVLAIEGVDGRPGLVARDGDGAVQAVIRVLVRGGWVHQVLVTRNPRKLRAWTSPVPGRNSRGEPARR